jgi:hypothetical protein
MQRLCAYAVAASLSSLSQWNIDVAKVLSSQIAIKGYFAGEAAGIRSANRESLCFHFVECCGILKLVFSRRQTRNGTAPKCTIY